MAWVTRTLLATFAAIAVLAMSEIARAATTEPIEAMTTHFAIR